MANLSRRVFLGSAVGAAVVGAALWSDSPLAAEAAQATQTSSRRVSGVLSGDNIVYPADSFAATVSDPGVLDVKALFGAVGDGVTDDTAAIIAAYDAVESAIAASPTDTAASQKIIYFPNGTYLVSDTLIYSFPTFFQTANPAQEGLCNLRLRGQSTDGVVIKLADSCPGFGSGAHKPVVSFAKATTNNTVATNFVENLTIDIGAGNPGAIGLLYAGANNGAIRGVKVVSSDPAWAGDTGIAFPVQATQLLLYDVEIDGFDYAVTADAWSATHVTLEGLTISNQNLAGVQISKSLVTMRDFTSTNSVPAIVVTDAECQLIVIDSEFDGGAFVSTAIDLQAGMLFARNLTVAGYGTSISKSSSAVATGDVVEYVSESVNTDISGTSTTSQPLPFEALPYIAWPDTLTDWESVNSHGAAGDGVTEDHLAIQAAMDSGQPVIYFLPGEYLLRRTITIPSTVQRINFMYTGMKVGSALEVLEGTAHDLIPPLFKIEGSSSDPALIIEDMNTRAGNGTYRLFEQASDREVVFSDLHTQRGAMLWNSVGGGKTHLSNVSARAGTLSNGDYGPTPFYFEDGQDVWAHHINPEYGDPEIVNSGANLWILGFKTEASSTILSAASGSQTEWLGGCVLYGHWDTPSTRPLIQVDNSILSLTLATTGPLAATEPWTLYVDDIQGLSSGSTSETDLPPRGIPGATNDERFVPLYVAGA